jgi:hypothetical protein
LHVDTCRHSYPQEKSIVLNATAWYNNYMTKEKLTEKEREAYAIVGRLGGKATAKKLGKKGMRELGKRGAKARWSKKVTVKKKK